MWQHVQRGTFCDFHNKTWHNWHLQGSSEDQRFSISSNHKETPNQYVCICMHPKIYTNMHACTHAGVTTNPGTCWLQKHYAGHLACPVWTQQKTRQKQMKEWTNEKTYPKRQAVNKFRANSFPLLPKKTSLVFLSKHHNQIISMHWNITLVLNHPTEQSFWRVEKLRSHDTLHHVFLLVWIIFQILIYLLSTVCY